LVSEHELWRSRIERLLTKVGSEAVEAADTFTLARDIRNQSIGAMHLSAIDSRKLVMWLKCSIFAGIALAALSLAGCSTTQERVSGAGAGALVGSVAGPPGAVLGAVGGAIIGPSVSNATLD
jgi:hypothetical protein